MAEKDLFFDSGLSTQEVADVEGLFDLKFPPDLRTLLQERLPVSPGFTHWRYGLRDPQIANTIRTSLPQPWEGIAFDIRVNAFWYPPWVEIPLLIKDKIEVARKYFASAPQLIPIYGSRYLPEQPCESGNPVLSVSQTDIVCDRNNLIDYLVTEFALPTQSSSTEERHIEFWSSIIEWGSTPLSLGSAK